MGELIWTTLVGRKSVVALIKNLTVEFLQLSIAKYLLRICRLQASH